MKWNIPETDSPIRNFPYMVHPVKGADLAGKHQSTLADSGVTLRKKTNKGCCENWTTDQQKYNLHPQKYIKYIL